MKIAVVCAMNQNRSMEAHAALRKEGYDVCSYGTNRVMRLPGPTPAAPNEYAYTMTYREIHDDLAKKDEALYRSNGLLMMVERNMRIKERPENFFASGSEFDLVVTCEEKCFSAIFDHCATAKCKKFFLVNFDIADTLADAISGSQKIVEFVTYFSEYETGDMEEAIAKALERYAKDNGTQLLFSVVGA